MRQKLIAMLGNLLMPVLLWAWGNDVRVWNFVPSGLEQPVAYDIAWINDTTLIAGIGYTKWHNEDTTFVVIYRSVDNGQNWNLLTYLVGRGKLLNIQFENDTECDSVYMMLHEGSAILLYKLDPLTMRGLSNIYSDSCDRAFIKQIRVGGVPYLFLAVGKERPLRDTLKVIRTNNLSIMDSIEYSFGIDDTGNVRTLRDFDIAIKGDTVLLYCTYEEKASIINKDIKAFVSQVPPSGSISYRGILNVAVSSQTETYPSMSVISVGSGVIWVYEASGDLKYFYSSNYGTSGIIKNFPHNTTGVESSPAVVDWFRRQGMLFFYGFDLAYLSGNEVYYSRGSFSGDSIVWGSPFLVSDQVTLSTFPLYNNYNYQIKITEQQSSTGNFYIPAVMWHRDFWRSFMGNYYHDSTGFYVDYLTAVSVSERPEVGYGLRVYVVNNNLVVRYAGFISSDLLVRVFDVSGRENFESQISERGEELVLDISRLKAGVYFLLVQNKGATYFGRFVKVN